MTVQGIASLPSSPPPGWRPRGYCSHVQRRKQTDRVLFDKNFPAPAGPMPCMRAWGCESMGCFFLLILKMFGGGGGARTHTMMEPQGRGRRTHSRRSEIGCVNWALGTGGVSA